MTRIEGSRRYPVSAKGTAATSERIRSRRPARASAKPLIILGPLGVKYFYTP